MRRLTSLRLFSNGVMIMVWAASGKILSTAFTGKTRLSVPSGPKVLGMTQFMTPASSWGPGRKPRSCVTTYQNYQCCHHWVVDTSILPMSGHVPFLVFPRLLKLNTPPVWFLPLLLLRWPGRRRWVGRVRASHGCGAGVAGHDAAVLRGPTPPDGQPPGWKGNSKGSASSRSQHWMDKEGNWHYWRQVSCLGTSEVF